MWAAPYLAFVEACYFDHTVAFLPAYAAIRSLASASMSGASEAPELEQWAEDDSGLPTIAALLMLSLCSLGFAVVDNCCQASSDSSVIVLPSAEGNCPSYCLIPVCLELQVFLGCGGRCHHKETAWHAEGPEVVARYGVAGLSFVVVDEEKCLEAKSMLNCCCSNHLHGIEKCP